MQENTINNAVMVRLHEKKFRDVPVKLLAGLIEKLLHTAGFFGEFYAVIDSENHGTTSEISWVEVGELFSIVA